MRIRPIEMTYRNSIKILVKISPIEIDYRFYPHLVLYISLENSGVFWGGFIPRFRITFLCDKKCESSMLICGQKAKAKS